MANEPDDLYTELGVSENSTAKDIAAAWRLRVSVWHPDKHNGAPQKLQDLAKETTARLNRAKDILLDPEKRRQYDAKRKERQAPRRAAAGQSARPTEDPAKPDWQRAADESYRQERTRRTDPRRGADGRWKRSEGSTGRARKPASRQSDPITTSSTAELVGGLLGTVIVCGLGLGAAAASAWLVFQIPGAIHAAFSAIPKAWLLVLVVLALLALWSPRLVLGLALFAAWCWVA